MIEIHFPGGAKPRRCLTEPSEFSELFQVKMFKNVGKKMERELGTRGETGREGEKGQGEGRGERGRGKERGGEGGRGKRMERELGTRGREG